MIYKVFFFSFRHRKAFLIFLYLHPIHMPTMMQFSVSLVQQAKALLQINYQFQIILIQKGTNDDIRIRDSVVGIVTSYGLDDRGVGVRVLVGSRILSSPRHPDQL
jgi:hypothetical protein